jgi:hypothetical protein
VDATKEQNTYIMQKKGGEENGAGAKNGMATSQTDCYSFVHAASKALVMVTKQFAKSLVASAKRSESVAKSLTNEQLFAKFWPKGRECFLKKRSKFLFSKSKCALPPATNHPHTHPTPPNFMQKSKCLAVLRGYRCLNPEVWSKCVDVGACLDVCSLLCARGLMCLHAV